MVLLLGDFNLLFDQNKVRSRDMEEAPVNHQIKELTIWKEKELMSSEYIAYSRSSLYRMSLKCHSIPVQ
jgi:hypothetical protein